MTREVTVAQLMAAAADDGGPPVTEAVASSADSHFITSGASGRTAARSSIWWTHAPALAGERTGVIGHFAAADPDSAARVLESACAALAAARCTVAIGPMDGTTWQRYRLVTDPGEEPPFFLEPTNPASWPHYFAAAGFSEGARYFSALNSDLALRDERADARWRVFQDAGITIRTIDLNSFSAELQRIYGVAVVSFRDSFLYTPVTEHAFEAQYAQLRSLVDPSLVLLAEHDGRTVGFSFGIPDVLEAAAGRSSRTAIIKTLAVLPGRTTYAGLGSVLTARTHQQAREAGYNRCIHALMHQSNYSRALSARTARVMRQYALFSRTLRS